MTLKNTEDHWGSVSQALHWLVVLLILVLAAVGLSLDSLPKTPKYFWVFTLHKSVGITVLALVLVRIAWRLFAGAPEPVAGMPRWQVRAANATHVLMYVLLLAMPLSGWLYDSASGLRPFRLFGLVAMPKLAAPDESLRHTALTAHQWLFWILAATVLLHVVAALHHHWVRHDTTLVRMLPRRRSSP